MMSSLTPSDLDVMRRVAESSPVIVLILLGACWLLWRRLEKKDDAILALNRETLIALGAVTAAVKDLKDALDARR
jgi:hypothetical protein